MIYEVCVPTNCDGDGNELSAIETIYDAGIKFVMPVNRSANFEKSIARARELGLGIPYAHLEFSDAYYLWAQGVMNRKYIENSIKQIELCSKYGIDVVILHAVSGEPAISALPPSPHGIESMKEILVAAEKCGVKIALENTDYSNRRHLEYLLDSIKSPWLGFCYDCGHHHLYTPGIDLMKKYGDRCIAVHLHDNFLDYSLGYDWTRDLHFLPFDGKIDFDKVALELAGSAYDSTITIESYHLSVGLPQLYKNLTLHEFLCLLKERGAQFASLVKLYRAGA